MHTLPALLAMIVLTAFCGYGQPARSQPAEQTAQPEMVRYYAAFLRRGPAWTAENAAETRALGAAHQANIQRLIQAGKMVVAGPFVEQSGERALAGLFILRVATAAEAEELVAGDPAVRAGRFTYEIVPWFGPKSLTY